MRPRSNPGRRCCGLAADSAPLLLVLVALLFGCGRPSDPTPPPSDPAAQSSKPAAPPSNSAPLLSTSDIARIRSLADLDRALPAGVATNEIVARLGKPTSVAIVPGGEF